MIFDPYGAEGEGRTPTTLRSRDFESRASASSATSAWVRFELYNFRLVFAKKKDLGRLGCLGLGAEKSEFLSEFTRAVVLLGTTPAAPQCLSRFIFQPKAGKIFQG